MEEKELKIIVSRREREVLEGKREEGQATLLYFNFKRRKKACF